MPPSLPAKPHFYLGNPNYSSWSLRPWLCLRWGGIDFDETFVDLDRPGYGKAQIAEVLAVSPSGRVPALHVGPHVIWDSLAIAEWAAEIAPERRLWPADPWARAAARSVTCEMHSGFTGIRRDLSMNIRRRVRAYGLSEETRVEIARMDQLWSATRAKHGGAGPYLFGHRTIADAFFTPVATRFRTYDIELSREAAAYRDALLADDAFLEWERRVLAEPATRFSRANTDDLYATPEPAPAG
jgi:glutathione S-transferase